MKLNADIDSPDYHLIVHFIDKVTVDGKVITDCISFDTEKGEAVCYKKDDAGKRVLIGEYLMTEVVTGKVEIIWKPTVYHNDFLYHKVDWEARELAK